MFACQSILFPQLDSPAAEKMRSTGVEDAGIVKTSIARVASKSSPAWSEMSQDLHLLARSDSLLCILSLQFLFTWLFLSKLFLVFLKSPRKLARWQKRLVCGSSALLVLGGGFGDCVAELLSEWFFMMFSKWAFADFIWLGLSRSRYLGSRSVHARNRQSWSGSLGSVMCRNLCLN